MLVKQGISVRCTLKQSVKILAVFNLKFCFSLFKRVRATFTFTLTFQLWKLEENAPSRTTFPGIYTYPLTTKNLYRSI